MRVEGSTTDIADLEGKRECIPEVPAPPELECSDNRLVNNAEVGVVDADAGVGVDVEAASCVLITITLRSIRYWIASRRVKQLLVE